MNTHRNQQTATPRTASTVSDEYPAMPPCPAGEYVFYGVPVAAYIEDSGVLVAGHGRRSWAALNAYYRGERIDPRTVTAKWVTFVETCGCTAEQHDAHLAEQRAAYLKDLAGDYLGDDFPDCDSHCAHPGLPPCETTMFAWRTETVDPAAPAAMPALELT
ncbi:MAG TPA: hypothetical protein VE196_07165 [Pseudonocardiaceae bacterium]|jgi:hypothetical protein|nr:hypothetical protein [Pseudonocardiaceae bacterium]